VKNVQTPKIASYQSVFVHADNKEFDFN